MIIHVDVNRLIELNLTADQYVWLKLMYEGQTKTATRMANVGHGETNLGTYLVSVNPPIINRSTVRDLFHLNDNYFWEFYSEYPLKVPARNGGYRALKTQRTDTKLAKTMEKKYKGKIKTLEQHQHVMRCLKADIDHRKRNGSMQYLPAIEAYINGQDWETAEHLLEGLNGVQSPNAKDSYGETLI